VKQYESEGIEPNMTSRRTLLKLASLSPLMRVTPAWSQDKVFAHAVSVYNDIKYKSDFKHFDYVNPVAPKGGKVRLPAFGTFDSLNPFTIKGDPAAVSVVETLLTKSFDEPSTEYGLIAEGVYHPEDISSATYRLRKEARFHDGKLITPEDVIWSFEAIKANIPTRAAYYKDVVKVEQTDDRDVTFVFGAKSNRELPSIIGQISVMPKHWWLANGEDGKPRDIAASTLEIPLGSGPYKFKRVIPGSSIVLERVPDYWGKDLPVNVGTNNFDELSYIYFQSPLIAFEGFKGDQFDYYPETISKNWATGYNFPAIKDGRCVKEEITLKKVNGMQGWVLNLRRPKFQDVRVRKAFNLAFDFEWANTNLFYGQYTRARSFFNNSELEAKGLPSPEELVLLEPLKDRLPAEVFTMEYANPTNPNSTARRSNLRAASKLLAEAGWNVAQQGGKNVLKNAAGETLSVEITLDNPAFERIALPYKEQLALLGVNVSVRAIDAQQFVKIKETFNYDIIVHNFGQTMSPGNEQRFFWGSEAAGKNGTENYAGIKDKAIDALIDMVIFAKDRKGLVTACRALDRALVWGYYMVPQWFIGRERIAHWDRFGRPETTPDFALGFPSTWWWDEEKAKKVSAG
jgi:microcin C transport system substrate-binding protein